MPHQNLPGHIVGSPSEGSSRARSGWTRDAQSCSRSSVWRFRRMSEGPSRPRGGSKAARHTAPRRGLGPLLPSRLRPLPRPPTRHAPVSPAPREHDVWVAVEGAAIGWVEVDRDRVAALYVSPPCSRRGVGSVLLTFAETSIRSSGYTTARLESSQNALDYYLRRGYLRCGPADSDGAWPLRRDLAAVTPNQGMEPTR